jgi:hypothetical protein
MRPTARSSDLSRLLDPRKRSTLDRADDNREDFCFDRLGEAARRLLSLVVPSGEVLAQPVGHSRLVPVAGGHC